MLCLHTGNLGQDWWQLPLERDVGVSQLLLERGSTRQWPHSVLVSPGQSPTEGLRGPQRMSFVDKHLFSCAPKAFQVSMGNSL